MRTCDGGHPMAAVTVRGGTVRLVCLTCLQGVTTGPGRIRRGSEMRNFRLVELVSQLEASESGGEFAPLDVGDVPGFDRLFSACETAGVPFNSAGLRTLARRIAARNGHAVAAVMSMRPEAVADCVTRLALRPERARV